jgi:drug/metabolite transporter (DMT)-like permease
MDTSDKGLVRLGDGEEPASSAKSVNCAAPCETSPVQVQFAQNEERTGHFEDHALLSPAVDTLTTSAPAVIARVQHSTEAPGSAFAGLVLVVLSSAAFASLSLLVSQSSRLGIPSLQSATVRFSVQTLLSALWISRAKHDQLDRQDTWLGKPENRRLLVLRGIIGAVAMCCLFYAVSTLPLADATCIAFLNVPLTTIIAACTLGERYTLADGAACIASSIGVLLVVQPTALFGGNVDLPLLSVCIALTYACLSSCVFVTIRAIGPRESSLVLVLYFGVTGCIVAPALLGLLQTPSAGLEGHAAEVAGLQV